MQILATPPLAPLEEHRKSLSVRARLYLLALFLAVPACAYVAHSIVTEIQSEFTAAEREMLSLAQITAADTRNFLDDSHRMLARFSQRMAIREAERGKCDLVFFQTFSGVQTRFSNLGLANRAGTLLCTSTPIAEGKKISVAHRHWFKAVEAGSEFAVGDLMVDQVTGNKAVAFGVPVRDANGELSGALGISLSLARYQPVTSAAQLPPGSIVAIVNGDGIVLSSSIDGQHAAGMQVGDSSVIKEVYRRKQGLVRGVALDRIERIYGFASVETADWYALTGIPVQWVHEAARAGFLRQAGFGLATIGVLAFLAWYLGRSIERPVRAIARVAREVAAGKLATRIAIRGPAEIEDVARALNEMLDVRTNAEAALRDSEERLEERVRARTAELEIANDRLKENSSEVTALDDLSERLHTCASTDEAIKVAARFMRNLFDAESGGIFLMSTSHDLVVGVSVWGNIAPAEQAFSPEACCALRSGKSFVHTGEDTGLACQHLTLAGHAYLCVPMMAQSETIGIIHMRETRPASTPLGAHVRITEAVAERAGLAIANLNLREALRQQSIHDPLTGLYNRRFLEESLNREMARCERNGTAFAVLMIDVDHFKRFNDTYGHDAGDDALRAISGALRKSTRETDIVCRFGGEEFVVVLPDTGLAGATTLAQRVIDFVRGLEIIHNGRALTSVTASLGLAMYPQNGETVQAIIQSADKALYEAKGAGRDRIMLST